MRRWRSPRPEGLLAKHGIFNRDNLAFDELLADREYPLVYRGQVLPHAGA
jgi:hypothetical protein